MSPEVSCATYVPVSGRLGFTRFRVVEEGLPRPFNGVALFVQQVLDFEQKFNVFTPVQAVPGAGLLRRQARKLGFPIAQDVRFDSQQTGHFADPEIQLVWYLGCIAGYCRICHQPFVILPYCAGIVTNRADGGCRSTAIERRSGGLRQFRVRLILSWK